MIPPVLGRVVAWLRGLPPFAILAAGWFVFFMYAYPGLMTPESFVSLQQARAGVFVDEPAPLMQAIVWITDPLIAGPTGIVIVQSWMLLAGGYLLLRRAMRARVAALVAVGVSWFPPIVAVMTTMWPQPMMAGALVLAAALIISPSRRVRLAGLTLAVVAAGVRPGGFAAVFAIVVLLFEWRSPMPRLRRYALALAVWSGVVGAAMGGNALLADRDGPAQMEALPIIVTHADQDRNRLWEHGISITTSRLQQGVDAALSWLADTPLFEPWMYRVLALGLLALALALRRSMPLVLLLSGLGMELWLFFVDAGAYRDSHWMICATILAGILLFADRLRGNPRAA